MGAFFLWVSLTILFFPENCVFLNSIQESIETQTLLVLTFLICLHNITCFLCESLEILNVSNTLTLKQIFLKMKSFFKILEYRFWVESTKIEKATSPTFPKATSNKTALSEAIVKTNRMGCTKWTDHKEQSFASNCFIFLKILFQFKDLQWVVDLIYQLP